MDIAIAQTNPTVGDLEGNLAKALILAEQAAEQGALLLIYPAHVLTGVPLGGLAACNAFLDDARLTLEKFAVRTPIACVVSLGTWCAEAEQVLPEIFLVHEGEVHSLGWPILGDETPVIDVNGVNIALLAEESLAGNCELAGIDVFVEMAADSVFELSQLAAAEQPAERMKNVAQICHAHTAYANLCGAADSMVFAGHSCVFQPDGGCVYFTAQDENALLIFDTSLQMPPRDLESPVRDERADAWQALVTATRDYVQKNGFEDVVIGLSGGIDSAVVATIAADALGPEHVHGILMPSRFSSEGSLRDANALAETLGLASTHTIPINAPVETLHAQLAEVCGGAVEGLAAENLQARIRMVYLMCAANARGWLALNTGNKSEAAMGFSTLYGDTVGAFAPIGNLYKTEVYALAAWRVQQGDSIPFECITKAPSAELYEGARDDHRLPPYEQLDAILRDHIDEGLSLEQLIAAGHEPKVARQVVQATQRNEFKRRLEPIAPQLTSKSLTEDRAWPITNAWRQ